MYKVLKPFKWFMHLTGETIEFIGKDVSTCGKKLEDLGDDILKELESKKYITKQVNSVENKPDDLDEKPKKSFKKEK